MSKSFLSELIRKVRLEFKIRPSNLDTAIKVFKKAIVEKLDELYKAGNLRIYDDNHGGVVRGPKRSRQTSHCEDKNGVLLCDRANFDGCVELSYFRAVFNLPRHSFKITAKSEVRLIGYESPLMRKKRGRNSRATACDLIGLTSDNRILCIEGKVKPHRPATDIVYGLLESFAYGVCIEYFLAEENRQAEFKKEVQACLNEFHPNTNGFNEGKLTAAFTLAAPREYFAQYFEPTHPMTKGKAKKRLSEAGQLLTAFEKIKRHDWAWAGFMIMEPPCTSSSFDKQNERTFEEKTKENTYVEPHFKSEPFKVDLAWDISELKDNLIGT